MKKLSFSQMARSVFFMLAVFLSSCKQDLAVQPISNTDKTATDKVVGLTLENVDLIDGRLAFKSNKDLQNAYEKMFKNQKNLDGFESQFKGFTSQKQAYDNANYEGDKLVVNGTIEANIGVTITLSKSQSPAGIIKKEGFNVKNGRVWLYQNDTLVAEMTLNAKGKYIINNFRPQAGKAYWIKAVAEGLDTAESQLVIIPQLPIINSYILKKDNSYASNQGKSGAFFSIDIKDDANEKNFYLINSYIQISSDSINYGFLSYVPHDYESCEFDGGAIASFTDKCFNGSNFTIDYVSEHTNKGTWKVQLSSINKLFFTYLHNWQQPTGLELGFSEPKLAISNIKNGYGMFVAKNTVTFSLKLD